MTDRSTGREAFDEVEDAEGTAPRDPAEVNRTEPGLGPAFATGDPSRIAHGDDRPGPRDPEVDTPERRAASEGDLGLRDNDELTTGDAAQ